MDGVAERRVGTHRADTAVLAPLTSEDPKVSVLVTNYNFGRFVIEAVNSVLAQTYRNLEVIVCDDGSTDDSLERIARAFDGDRRVVYLTQPNAGQAAAFNAAFARASGELVALLDADDLYLPQRVARVVEHFRASPGLGLLSHQLRVVDEELRPLRSAFPAKLDEGWLGTGPSAVGAFSKAPSSGLTIHRAVAERVFPLPPDFRICADAVIARRAAVLSRIGALHEVLALYRQHAANNYGADIPLTAEAAGEKLALARRTLDDHRSFFRSVFGYEGTDDDLVRKALAEVQLGFDLLAGNRLDNRLIQYLPMRRTQALWGLLAALPRPVSVAILRLKYGPR
jgi:glycosyltransferase involved in cell wall biosynthesis